MCTCNTGIQFTFLFVTLQCLIIFSVTYACLVCLDSTWAHLYYNEDQQPYSIMHTTAPFLSSPCQRPCVSAASYRTRTSYPATEIGAHPDRGMVGQISVCACMHLCVCEGEWEKRDVWTRRQGVTDNYGYLFFCLYVHILSIHSCTYSKCVCLLSCCMFTVVYKDFSLLYPM